MIRTLSSILFLVLIAPPLLADDVAPPRFFIERIEVRNAKRVSPDVVIAESRLREHHEYSEVELRDASTRLQRLPFLLSAEFSLEKGSERGRHVLVITISETKNFFFSLDARPIYRNDYNTDVDLSDHDSGTETEGVIGMRFFVGRRGAIHFGLFAQEFQRDFASDYSAFAVGYTQYDLFGTRAFATLNLKRVIGGGAGEGSSITPQLVVGVPLSPNQTLTLGIDDTRFANYDRHLFGETYHVQRSQRVVTAAWSYNTTNHPFLPTRGMVLQAKPMMSWTDGDSFAFVVDDPLRPPTVIMTKNHTRAMMLELSGSRYWEISDRNSVSAGMTAAFGRITERRTYSGPLVLPPPDPESTYDGQYAILRGGFSHSLWDSSRAKDGDSRLELNVRLLVHEGDRFDQTTYGLGELTQQVSASWVRRSSWGTFRLGAGYAW